MDHSDSMIPNFAQVFEAAVGSVTTTPVMPPVPTAGPIDREIRRIDSAHQPAVREVASDNEIGRDIVDDDARRLAVQKRSVRKQAQRRGAAAKPGPDEPT
ncbi:hypothetical protein [Herbaspirillum sp. YR522]|uniref:hypothetical protein n=1 Tax=Herbaspirillum sp. YR522 TaxID=1144342 RepID=UPI00026F884D|nr:hypothetical protein [Herbaspirillum sp. YR522]EJN06948.1 hypothetical protein PMI40_02133 [Herbaspirillum sp. YR522]